MNTPLCLALCQELGTQKVEGSFKEHEPRRDLSLTLSQNMYILGQGFECQSFIWEVQDTLGWNGKVRQGRGATEGGLVSWLPWLPPWW